VLQKGRKFLKWLPAIELLSGCCIDREQRGNRIPASRMSATFLAHSSLAASDCMIYLLELHGPLTTFVDEVLCADDQVPYEPSVRPENDGTAERPPSMMMNASSDPQFDSGAHSPRHFVA
jgi:hypothetical protein